MPESQYITTNPEKMTSGNAVAGDMGIICSILKKDFMYECSNLRGISLLYVAYKIIINLLNRIYHYCKSIIGNHWIQKKRSKLDLIFILKRTKAN